jgi:hypothetical protein
MLEVAPDTRAILDLAQDDLPSWAISIKERLAAYKFWLVSGERDIATIYEWDGDRFKSQFTKAAYIYLDLRANAFSYCNKDIYAFHSKKHRTLGLVECPIEILERARYIKMAEKKKARKAQLTATRAQYL